MRNSLTRSRVSVTLAAIVVMLIPGLATPSAHAVGIAACTDGVLNDGDQCTLAPGDSISYTIKAGNGGTGGAGGAGGSGGASSASGGKAGGTGGAGGSGGAGGAGAKVQGTYTNSSGSTQTLTFTIGLNGATGDVGATGATGATGNPNGVTGVSGDGGTGGGGGGDTTITVGGTTIAIAYGGNGGNGGKGGAGGQGGQGSTSVGANGSAGSNGTAGASGSGANVATSNTEAPSIQITLGPSVAAAPIDTLTFRANGGRCTTTSVSGPRTAWVPLPGVLDCSKTGAVLTGWRADGTTYWPEQAVQLTGSNTLTAVWGTDAGQTGSTSAGTGSGSSTTTKPSTTVRVVWTIRGNRAVLESGRPKALAGRRAAFTIETSAPGRVTKRDIAVARSLATRYGGTYRGLRFTSTWRAPHIVATAEGSRMTRGMRP